jgi:hypothetical protein
VIGDRLEGQMLQALKALQEKVLGPGISPSTNTDAILVFGRSLRTSAIDPDYIVVTIGMT